MGKLWGGRFTEETDRLVEEFTSSIEYDHLLFREDIEGSRVHCRMLVKQGIISKEEGEAILKGLDEIEEEIAQGKLPFKAELEDIHMHVEQRLKEKIGPVGGKLHTARSRNDQIALDFRLYLLREKERLVNLLREMQEALLERAEANIDLVMPGFTHLQHAQPVLVAFHLLAYVEMFQRDKERLRDWAKRASLSPLGSCALAGTSFPVDRHFTCQELGLSAPTGNAMDSVSDRDFALEMLSILSIVAIHLSRMAEEIVLWSSTEFSFVTLPDGFCTGSSIMPQKKNPDVAELVRGKTGRVLGAMVSLFTTMKGLPLAYNRDMQEDKEPLLDALETVKGSLQVMSGMVRGITFNGEVLEKRAREGFTTATDLADYLVRKGVPFRDAHGVVGRIVAHCVEKGLELDQLTLETLKGFSPLIEEDVFQVLGIRESVNSRNSFGGTSRAEVERQIARWKEVLGEEQ